MRIKEQGERYRHLNQYLKERFGERTLKICVDGGFTCPNRDGTVGTGGCIFCSERGSGEHIQKDYEIEEQIRNYFKSYKAQRANRFVVYFQNYSNTYDSVINLKRKYDAALGEERIVGLAIATRPDCIDAKIVSLLKDYQKRYAVWVELGLQTANEEIGRKIQRGYTNQQFMKAVKLLNQAGIDVVVHIMVGLPGESREDRKDTIHIINTQKIQGIKIHSTYVVANTILAKWYEQGKYKPITLEEYLEALVEILTHISPEMVIHRVSGDAPKDLLIAPEWNLHKKWVLNGLDKILIERDLWQGKYFGQDNW